MLGFHLFCHPKVYTTEGTDHFGKDAFLRCPSCRKRTVNHVECHAVTPHVRKMLHAEWRSGRTVGGSPS